MSIEILLFKLSENVSTPNCYVLHTIANQLLKSGMFICLFSALALARPAPAPARLLYRLFCPLQWGLVCGRAGYVSSVAAVFMAGRIIGCLFAGHIADRYVFTFLFEKKGSWIFICCCVVVCCRRFHPLVLK